MATKRLGVIERKFNIANCALSLNLATSRDCVRWSEDDRVAVVTNDDIKILELYHPATSIEGFFFEEINISCPSQPNKHFESGIETSAITSECNETLFVRLEVEKIIFSPALSCLKRASVHRSQKVNIPMGDFVTYTAFKHMHWSPLGAAELSRCLLVAATRDHQLFLFTDDCSENNRINLTKLHTKWIKSRNWPLIDTTNFTPSEKIFNFTDPPLNISKLSAKLTQEMLAQKMNSWTSKVKSAQKKAKENLGKLVQKDECDITFRHGERMVKKKVQDLWSHSNRLSQLAINAVVWSPLVKSSSTQVMIISLTGHCLLYEVRKKVPFCVNEGENTWQSFGSVECRIANHFNLEIPKLITVKWIQSPSGSEYLLIGEETGLLKVFTVERGTNSEVVSVVKICEALREDRVPVLCIEVIEWVEAKQLLVAYSRNGIFGVCLLQLGAECKVLATAESVLDCYNISSLVVESKAHIYASTSKGFVYDVSVLIISELLNSTECHDILVQNESLEHIITFRNREKCKEPLVSDYSVQEVQNNESYVTSRENFTIVESHDGITTRKMKIVKTEYKNANVNLSFCYESLSYFTNKNMAYLGMACSKNKAIYCSAEIVAVAYDHLVLREPTKLVFYIVNSLPNLTEALLSKHREMELNLANNSNILTAIKIHILYGAAFDTNSVFKELSSSGQGILFHLAQNVGAVLSPPTGFETWEDVAKHYRLEIMKKWILEVIDKYHNDSSSIDSLQDSEKEVLFLMCSYMSDKDNSISEKSRSLLRLIGDRKEICGGRSCSQSVEITSLLSASCPEAHLSNRCSISLVSRGLGHKCPNCSVAVNAAIASLFRTPLTCLYCNGLLKECAKKRKKEITFEKAIKRVKS